MTNDTTPKTAASKPSSSTSSIKDFESFKEPNSLLEKTLNEMSPQEREKFNALSDKEKAKFEEKLLADDMAIRKGAGSHFSKMLSKLLKGVSAAFQK